MRKVLWLVVVMGICVAWLRMPAGGYGVIGGSAADPASSGKQQPGVSGESAVPSEDPRDREDEPAPQPGIDSESSWPRAMSSRTTLVQSRHAGDERSGALTVAGKSVTDEVANTENTDSSGAGPVAAFAPSVDQVRSDVEHNPHAPSQAVVTFSLSLHRKVESALASESAAADMLGELDACATNSGARRLSEVARVLCLSQAGRIATQFAALRARYENIELRAEARVVSLKRSMDRSPAEG